MNIYENKYSKYSFKSYTYSKISLHEFCMSESHENAPNFYVRQNDIFIIFFSLSLSKYCTS